MPGRRDRGLLDSDDLQNNYQMTFQEGDPGSISSPHTQLHFHKSTVIHSFFHMLCTPSPWQEPFAYYQATFCMLSGIKAPNLNTGLQSLLHSMHTPIVEDKNTCNFFYELSFLPKDQKKPKNK